MKVGLTAAVAAMMMLGAGAAQAVEVHQSATVKVQADALWQKIGDFCAIKDWHPAIATCSEIHAPTVRTLVT